MLNSNRGIKTILYFNCVMEREGAEGTIRQRFAFHSAIKLILEGTDVEEVFNEMIAEIEEAMQKAQNAEGSGWTLAGIESITLHTANWDPLNAGSYMELPEFLKNLCGVCYGH